MKLLNQIFSSFIFFNRGNELSEKMLMQNNLILLICLSLMIVLTPFFQSHVTQRWVGDILISFVILSSISSYNFSRRTLNQLVYVGIAALLLIWISYFTKNDIARVFAVSCTAVYIIYITYALIVNVTKSRIVSKTILFNAINSYLLLGILGALFFAIINSKTVSYFFENVRAIHFPNTIDPAFHDYLYFSIVTITTLGYGDVLPVIPLAKSMTIIISIFGQLYLTILVAMLVGKYIANYNSNN